MTHTEIWLIGLALAADCFTVSIATGVSAKRFIQKTMLSMAISFGIFQGGMTLLGYTALSLFYQHLQMWDHWIAFAILAYLGCKMIYDDFRSESTEENNLRILSIGNILTMSVATSIDALAVGISFACTEASANNITYTISVIALCSTILSLVGLFTGIRLGRKCDCHAESIAGIILIIIGLKTLFEHLS